MNFIILILSLIINIEAKDSIKQDISNGIVFPSKNSAVREDPAAMALTSGDAVEVLAGLPQDDKRLHTSLSYEGSSDKAGFGMTYYQTAAGKSIYGAFGINADWIQMGMSGYFDINSWDASGDLGMRFGKIDGPAGAIVIRDFIGGFYHFVFAGAYNFSAPGIIVELDLDYQRSSNNLLAITKATLYRDNFSIHAGYTHPVRPYQSFTYNNLELGASFWLDSNLALLFLYHNELAEYLLGIKFDLD
jgi:hypothetical protein